MPNRPPTDMVVQWKLPKDPVESNSRRVVIRFRSGLSHCARYKVPLHLIDKCLHIQDDQTDIPRSLSDTCLMRYNAAERATDEQREDDFVRFSSLEELDQLGDQLFDKCHLDHAARPHLNSFSSTDINYLIALHCLPSVEMLDRSSSVDSLTASRSQFLPVSSLRQPDSQRRTAFDLKLMHNHPFYNRQRSDKFDKLLRTAQPLNESRTSLSDGESVATGSNSNVVNTEAHLACSRRVHFADEDSDSLSSITSNTSCKGGKCSGEAVQVDHCCTGVESRGRSSLDSHGSSSSNTKRRCHSDTTWFNGGFFRLFQKLQPKRRVRRQNRTPMLTVNLIRDTSQPPEIPRYVLSALEDPTAVKWQPTFPIADLCPSTSAPDRDVSLARFWSDSLTTVYLSVHAGLAKPPGLTHISPASVRVRYTLDAWAGWDESTALPLAACWPDATRPGRVVERYEGAVQLLASTRHVPIDRPQADWTRLEFAVVCRRDHADAWDNNREANYVCFKRVV